LGHKPDLVLVYGDVNSTAAAAMVCSKLLIPIGHVEAGLRSFDRTMPEEINRLITDQLSDFLFTPSKDADDNLLREGISEEKTHFVGNVMIDTLIRLQETADDENLMRQLKETEGFHQEDFSNGFGLVTLHRPSNVDNLEILAEIVQALIEVSAELPIVFPVHPRTRDRIEEAGLPIFNNRKLRFLDPIGYLQFLHLQKRATLVITDSGGIQEETTFLGVPCLTIRENTERPITIQQGTNILIGQDMQRLKAEVFKIKKGHSKKGKIPDLWDGKASDRIADKILKNL
jgi:UDP-N-acetylglucosamine 2-epimerase (non-hydrolysing)